MVEEREKFQVPGGKFSKYKIGINTVHSSKIIHIILTKYVYYKYMQKKIRIGEKNTHF